MVLWYCVVCITLQILMEPKKHIFSPMEKKVFRVILKKYENIIESKQTDGSTLKSKNTAWEHITKEFNASPLTAAKASVKQLRRLWMNLKQRQRDAFIKKRQQRLANGGGPAGLEAEVDPDIVGFLTPEMVIEVGNPNLPARTQVPTNTNPNTPSPPQSPILHSYLNSTIPTSAKTVLHIRKLLLEKEYEDREARSAEIHEMEMNILRERQREAKAKADLAELLLESQRKDAAAADKQD